MNIKVGLRKLYLKNRSEMKRKEVNLKSKLIRDNFFDNFISNIDDIDKQNIAIYYSINNEVKTDIFIESFKKIYKKDVFLPKILDNSSILLFRRYKIGDILENNLFFSKILEPLDEFESVIPDIVICPIVAFDKDLNRIGMGGGFYDRTIHSYRSRNISTKFIGIAYDSQLCDNVSFIGFDQKLDYIITERDIYSV